MKPLQLDSPEILERARHIQLFALDCDGILTDGKIFWIEGQGWTRSFSVRDGYGLSQVMNTGMEVALITAAKEIDVRMRMRHLGVKRASFATSDKLAVFQQFIMDMGLNPEEAAFMGDDVIDLPAMREAGLSITVPDAHGSVIAEADCITRNPGGRGAVREVTDFFMKVLSER